MIGRVTEIIRDAGLMSTAHFNDWARDRGTAVHLACQYHDEHRLDMKSIDAAVEPYLTQYLKFLMLIKPTIIEIEREVVDDLLGFVGHYDRLMDIVGVRCIVDIKTGPPQNWHGVQLAGYALAASKHYQRRGLYLTPSNWKLVRYSDRRDFTRFQAAMTVMQTRREWNIK